MSVPVERRRRSWGRRDDDRPSRVDLRLTLSIGLGLAAGTLLLHALESTIGRLRGILVTLLIAVFLSFAMEPAVQWLARRGMRRGFATWLVFFIAFAAMAGFTASMIPLVRDQVTTLIEEGPTLLDELAQRARSLPGSVGESVSRRLEELSTEGGAVSDELGQQMSDQLLGLGEAVVGGIFQALTVLLVTFYLVADGPKLRRTVSSWLPPHRQEDVLTIWELAIEKTGGYVYGRVLIAIASTVFHGIVFTIIGVPYAWALGAWVGVISSLVPAVGTYIGGALPFVVALARDPIDALWVLIAIVVYQQVENYLVAPRITSRTMSLHPAIAFIAVLVGAALLGAVGALLALPVAAIIGGLFSAAGERHEVVSHELLEGAGYDVRHPATRG